jgi:prepilin-type N-terminal cleavage/methylation domain-containing protein
MTMITTTTLQKNAGFTLLEMTVSITILVAVSFLMFTAMQVAAGIMAVSDAKEVAQASLRDTLREMERELQLSAKAPNPALIPPLQQLQVVNPSEIVFQIPVNSTGTQWSTPITYRFINEDNGDGSGAHNALLDAGEDTDGDGALTRRVVRIQDGESRPLSPCNDLSAVQFALNPTNDILTTTLTASKANVSRRHDVIFVTTSTQVYLIN